MGPNPTLIGNENILFIRLFSYIKDFTGENVSSKYEFVDSGLNIFLR